MLKWESDKMKYHVSISQPVPLQENADLHTVFIDSEKSSGELEKEITEFNAKQGRHVTVTVVLVPAKPASEAAK
jgi:hypothetical protein